MPIQYPLQQDVTAVSQDASVSDPEACAILLIGADNGQTPVGIKFRLNSGSGQIGGVFGYKSHNDYWIYVLDSAAGKRRIYHVASGVKTLKAETTDTTNPTTSDVFFFPHFQRRGVEGWGWWVNLAFPAGMPTGRSSLYTNVAGAKFEIYRVNDDAEHTDLMGRWINHTPRVNGGSVKAKYLEGA